MAIKRVDYETYFGNGNSGVKYDDFISFYDEVDIVDFQYHPATQQFTYPCPCGDLFIISLADLRNGETVAKCPSCSLIVMVSYGAADIEKYANE